jgi:predicted kinase
MSATIHIMHGFIGFGKTAIAKQMAAELPAVRLNNDELMVRLYGRNPPAENFQEYYNRIDGLIWCLAEQIVKAGIDVIIDLGGWSRQGRKEQFDHANKITDKVLFHKVICDLEVAKQRTVARTNFDEKELRIDEAAFDVLYKKFEPMSEDEGYPIINHYN